MSTIMTLNGDLKAESLKGVGDVIANTDESSPISLIDTYNLAAASKVTMKTLWTGFSQISTNKVLNEYINEYDVNFNIPNECFHNNSIILAIEFISDYGYNGLIGGSGIAFVSITHTRAGVRSFYSSYKYGGAYYRAKIYQQSSIITASDTLNVDVSIFYNNTGDIRCYINATPSNTNISGGIMIVGVSALIPAD